MVRRVGGRSGTKIGAADSAGSGMCREGEAETKKPPRREAEVSSQPFIMYPKFIRFAAL